MARTRTEQRAKRSRSSIRVLVVDDYHPVANVLADILEANFYDVRVAFSAPEALDIAEEFKPHALIADMTLPGMDGLKLAAEFKNRYPSSGVLLMSGGHVPKLLNGLRVVPKELAREEALRMLEDCRRLGESN
jgi:CheY-like chemotaxis protein